MLLGAGEISGGEIGSAGALEKERSGEGDDRRARAVSGGGEGRRAAESGQGALAGGAGAGVAREQAGVGGPSAGGSGPGNLLGRAGEWRSGPGASRWALRDGPLRRLGQAGKRRKVSGPGCWAEFGLPIGFRFLVLGLSWVSFLFPFLFKLTQPNLFEFKIEFEFNSNTQSNKAMHQHECTNILTL